MTIITTPRRSAIQSAADLLRHMPVLAVYRFEKQPRRQAGAARTPLRLVVAHMLLGYLNDGAAFSCSAVVSIEACHRRSF